MGFFTKEDFLLIAEYERKKVSDCPDGTHEKLKEVYGKLGEIAETMRPYFTVNITKNPQVATKENYFRDYFWARLCPKDAGDKVMDKLFFGIMLDKDGFSMFVDRNRKKTEQKDKELEGKADKISKESWERLRVEETCSLSKEKIVAKVKEYCDEYKHNREYYEIGCLYDIEFCIKKMEMQKYIDLLKANKNLILTGAPGTGKTFLAKEIAKAIVGADEDNGRVGFVQFHPSYDYTDFVEGLRPVKKDDTIGFERRDGIFMDFCRKALKEPNKEDYVFIIDEINRGEISKILGELFFAIDPGYRGRKGMVSTQYSNLWNYSEKDDYMNTKKFYIPENVYIIGTMNDIDRSVESMDFAMRRRFAFKEVTAESRQEILDEEFKEKAGEIKKRMNNLNSAIRNIPGLGSAYEVGAAYFLKLKNYVNNDNQLTDDSWKALWENHLKGLLFEYLRGMPDQEDQLNSLKDAYDLKDVNDKSSDSLTQSNTQDKDN